MAAWDKNEEGRGVKMIYGGVKTMVGGPCDCKRA